MGDVRTAGAVWSLACALMLLGVMLTVATNVTQFNRNVYADLVSVSLRGVFQPPLAGSLLVLDLIFCTNVLYSVQRTRSTRI